MSQNDLHCDAYMDEEETSSFVNEGPIYVTIPRKGQWKVGMFELLTGDAWHFVTSLLYSHTLFRDRPRIPATADSYSFPPDTLHHRCFPQLPPPAPRDHILLGDQGL